MKYGGCDNLESIASPTSMSFKNSADLAIYFGYCTSLSSIPSDLFKYCTNVVNFAGTFRGCTSLSNILADLFKYCTNVESFAETFSGCTNLTGQAIPLWERMENGATYNYESGYDINNDIIRGPEGFGCYSYCTGLTNYSSIPEYWKSLPVNQ